MKAIVLVVSVLLPWHEAAAQTFKCTDKAGKISYTNRPCNQLGLKDGGEVRDMIQITPAPPASTYRPPSRQTPVADDPPKPAAAAPEPEKLPEKRCFTTNVGGKSVTRCNDRPTGKDE
jgi:hypothetical protein